MFYLRFFYYSALIDTISMNYYVYNKIIFIINIYSSKNTIVLIIFVNYALFVFNTHSQTIMAGIGNP